jgi:hypothetical protein
MQRHLIWINFMYLPLQKLDPYHTIITMRGILVNYLDDCGTPTANMLTVKVLLKSIVLTNSAKCMTTNLKDFYLMMPMSRYEYFCIKIDCFSQDTIDEFNLQMIVDTNGENFCVVQQGMYSLPQASIIAQEMKLIASVTYEQHFCHAFFVLGKKLISCALYHRIDFGMSSFFVEICPTIPTYNQVCTYQKV